MAENARRIAYPDRGLMGKIQDVAVLTELTKTRTLFDEGAKFRLSIDNSDLSPMETASIFAPPASPASGTTLPAILRLPSSAP